MLWPFLVIPSILLSLLAYPLALILPYFAEDRIGPIDNNNGTAIEPRLPGWLSWFATADNSLLGDNGHKLRWSGRSKYWQMAAWVCRNPAYGFETDVCGATIKPFIPILYEGNRNIKNRDNAIAGKLIVHTGPYWCWKRILQVTAGHCLMFEFGWKLQGYVQRGAPTTPEKAQLVYSIRFTKFNVAK